MYAHEHAAYLFHTTLIFHARAVAQFQIYYTNHEVLASDGKR